MYILMCGLVFIFIMVVIGAYFMGYESGMSCGQLYEISRTTLERAEFITKYC